MYDRVIARTVVNSLDPDARPKAPLALVPFMWFVTIQAKMLWGGLWVGGDLFLTTRSLRFEPNAMNLSVHKNDCSWKIDLADVQSINVRKATVTNIIDIVHSKGVRSVRCYDAEQFADEIRSALQ